MATSKNLLLSGSKGTISNITVYQRMGTTVIRPAKNGNCKKSKSITQQRHRIRFANCTCLSKFFLQKDACCFSDRASNITQYNAFMHHNTEICTTYLTRDASQLNCSMPFDGLVLATGTLPAVGVEGYDESGRLCTTLSLGTLPIDANTPLSAIAEAIVNNNIGFRKGDEVVIVLCRITDLDVPFTIVRKLTLPLDGSDNRLAATVFRLKTTETTNQSTSEDAGLLDTLFLNSHADADGQQMLALDTRAVPNCAGVALYLHRVTSAGEFASRGVLHMLPGIADRYSSQAAFDLAVESYGGTTGKGALTPDDFAHTLCGEFPSEE